MYGTVLTGIFKSGPITKLKLLVWPDTSRLAKTTVV